LRRSTSRSSPPSALDCSFPTEQPSRRSLPNSSFRRLIQQRVVDRAGEVWRVARDPLYFRGEHFARYADFPELRGTQGAASCRSARSGSPPRSSKRDASSGEASSVQAALCASVGRCREVPALARRQERARGRARVPTASRRASNRVSAAPSRSAYPPLISRLRAFAPAQLGLRATHLSGFGRLGPFASVDLLAV
jgi:hypothetical protein